MSLTDPRAVARTEMNERERNARRICNELVVLGGAERESFILQALADAERRGLERAAEIAMKKAQEPWKLEAANREGMRIAQAIRVKARADKEEL